MTDWSIEQARRAYNVAHWADSYFDIDVHGQLVVQAAGQVVSIKTLVDDLRTRGFALPVLLRFTDILADRVRRLAAAFDEAIAEQAYSGAYTPVFPIKVNQQRSVVRQIVAQDPHCHGGVGLEAGSKPELMAVLALSKPGGVVVCNGYKDRHYVRLALLGRRLGLRVYIVVEKRSELERVITEARNLGVKPLLGIRVRLASVASGKWQNTGGEKGKFGLSAQEVLEAIDTLRNADMLDCLQLLHTHMGSQIANIRDIQRGIGEVGRFYADLHAMGVPIKVVDVGGGLGVDYEGARSRTDCSMNYSVAEYARNIVRTLAEICAERDLPQPAIFSESGRALAAHHAVLVSEVIDVEIAPGEQLPEAPDAAMPIILHDLWRLLEEVEDDSVIEVYHDAVHWLAEAQTQFQMGMVSLAQRAWAEQVYFAVLRRLQPRLRPDRRAHREILDAINDKLADRYICNLSVFQSMPDVWAINQIFPIMPLHNLDRAPTQRAMLQDLTCDSDGHIEQYVDSEGVETTLPLSRPRPGESLTLGIFLLGAYQEILGDIHNLFGDTHAVDVALTPDGYRLDATRRGETAADMLNYVGFNLDELRAGYHNKIATVGMDATAARTLLAELDAGLASYTYLTPDAGQDA